MLRFLVIYDSRSGVFLLNQNHKDGSSWKSGGGMNFASLFVFVDRHNPTANSRSVFSPIALLVFVCDRVKSGFPATCALMWNAPFVETLL